MPKKEKRIGGMELDLERPARLTRRQKADLAALAARPDDKIDYSEISPTTLKSWEQRAVATNKKSSGFRLHKGRTKG